MRVGRHAAHPAQSGLGERLCRRAALQVQEAAMAGHGPCSWQKTTQCGVLQEARAGCSGQGRGKGLGRPSTPESAKAGSKKFRFGDAPALRDPSSPSIISIIMLSCSTHAALGSEAIDGNHSAYAAWRQRQLFYVGSAHECASERRSRARRKRRSLYNTIRSSVWRAADRPATSCGPFASGCGSIWPGFASSAVKLIPDAIGVRTGDRRRASAIERPTWRN